MASSGINFERINKRMCHVCGNCVGICPTNCLSLSENGEEILFDKPKCTNCGLCYANCPGIEFSFPKAHSFFKDLYAKDVKYNELIGNYDSIYTGQTKDKQILSGSTSGGMVPAILIYALQKKLIDGAVLVVKSNQNPLGYKIIIARTRQEILGRVKSLYRMIPLNAILKKIKQEEKKGNVFNNLAFVGLPCHIEGIRKLQMSNDGVASKVRLILGIFCGLNMQSKAIDFILSKFKLKKEDIAEFSFRKNGWPGGIYIRTRDNKEYNLKKESYGFLYYAYAPDRCLLCYNFTNEFADISFGDAWSKLPSKQGWNDIIVRTSLGKKIISAINERNVVILEPLLVDRLINSHRGYFSFKKRGIFYRAKKLKLRPDYNVPEEKAGFSQKVIFSVIKVMRSGFFKKFSKIMPLKFIGNILLLSRKFLGVLFR